MGLFRFNQEINSRVYDVFRGTTRIGYIALRRDNMTFDFMIGTEYIGSFSTIAREFMEWV